MQQRKGRRRKPEVRPVMRMEEGQKRKRMPDARSVTRMSAKQFYPLSCGRPHLFLLLCGLASTTMGLVPLTRRRNHHHHHHPPIRLSTRRFVLTTPEAIIEQASTTKLLDDLIDESVRTSARRPIMMQFDPTSRWIWKRWKGTVFSETWDACVYRMIYASIVFLLCRSFPQVKDTLSGFAILWGQLLSVTTFTLTFFVNQSYALWRKCSELSRSLQGRLHDMSMTLATHATRKPPTGPNEPSTYTAEARQVLELVSRYVRLFNLLTYASFTRSHRPVLTPRGMRRLVERGLCTPLEREVLVNANIPATQRHNAVLLWIIRAFIEGKDAGHFTGDAGFEQQFIEKSHVCRSSYGAIGDELQGRMPLAYAHIVQVLVDLVLVMYPFMAYSAGMSGFVCVLGTGILTMGYQGLFDLAKQFLDPYDNENYGKGEDPLVVDTLIAETNAGSVRWMNGLAEMPLSPQKIKDGDLSEYLLPLRGYSVEELKQRKEEKKALQEKREREELERLRKEEQEQRTRQAAEAMIPALLKINGEASNADPDSAFFIIFNSTGDRMNIPCVFGASSVQTAETVNSIIFSQNSNATSLQESLIPEGTASALSYRYVERTAAMVEVAVVEPEKPVDVKENQKSTFFGEGDFVDDARVDAAKPEDDDDAYQAPHDRATESADVQKIDGFDPYLSLPASDKRGTDGKEMSFSQIVAKEIWEEEIKAAKRKAAVRIYEEHMKRAAELKAADESGLLETVGGSTRTSPDFQKYDQKVLGGISQLFGLLPNELAEIPSYEESSVPLADFGSRAQLGDSRSVRQRKPSLSVGEEAFVGNSQDGDLDLSDKGESVADEVWEVDSEPPFLIDQPFTFADYEKQLQELLEAEKEELRETQAILNAPPGADGIEVLEKDKSSLLMAMNSTDSKNDLILGMDAPESPSECEVIYVEDADVDADTECVSEVIDSPPVGQPFTIADYAKQVQQILEAQKVELLETQAILNAPPGADGIEVLENDKNYMLNNTDTMDDLTMGTDTPGSPSEGDVLAIEDIDHECVAEIPIVEPSTIADYEKKVRDIQEAEKEELLETQAILNAPPGADGIEIPEDRTALLGVVNSTATEDDLAILEMDAPDSPSEGDAPDTEHVHSDCVTEVISFVADVKGDTASPLIDVNDETVADAQKSR